MTGSMKKKNRKEWFDRIAEKARSLPAGSPGLYFPLRQDGASHEEIRSELKFRKVEFWIHGNSLAVYSSRQPEQPKQYLETCAVLGQMASS